MPVRDLFDFRTTSQKAMATSRLLRSASVCSRVAELKQLVCNNTTQRFVELAITEREQRLMAIQDRWDRLREAIVARAAGDHKRMMATGVVCMKLKSVRGKNNVQRPIRESVASFARAYQGAIGQAYRRLLETDLEFLTDRDADLWIPLFAICSVSAPDRVAELKRCAVTLSTAKAGDDADESLPLKLLADIKTVWPEGQERCDTESLLKKLQELEESPWAEYQLLPRKLANML